MILMRLLLLAVVVVPAVGCQRPMVEPVIEAPYGERQVWAVAPLRNETGTRHIDGLVMADRLARTFEQVQGIDVVPVNRVLEAMQALQMPAVQTREDAIRLREALAVDALVVGSMTQYSPYDPPKLGVALDLYAWPNEPGRNGLDIRGMSWAPTSDAAGVDRRVLHRPDQPVTTVSGYFDAAGIGTKQLIDRYAYGRGTTNNILHQRRLITINTNLFQEFVSYEVGSQLMWAEWQRMAQRIRTERQHAAAPQPANP